MTNPNQFDWHIGQRVITRSGTIATIVTCDPNGNVYAIGPCDRVPVVVRPVCDAWGGEHDCALRNAA